MRIKHIFGAALVSAGFGLVYGLPALILSSFLLSILVYDLAAKGVF